MKLVLLSLGLAGSALSVSPSPSRSQQIVPVLPAVVPGEAPGADEGTVLGYDTDFYHRMTVPVSIDGHGPYDFVVDTGAERTVIARELASQLDLGEGRKARMHSMSEVSDVTTVIIPELEVGGKQVHQIHAPALARRHLGAEGMLGVDSLKTQRVSFDFVRQQMTVTPSRKREEKWARDAIVVTARSRFGHLVLVDADVDGQKVWVIIDTGSQATIGNSALRRKLEKKGRLGLTRPVEMTSVTGGKVMAEQTVTKKIRIGGMDLRQMPIAFADVHPFRKLDLMDRPALLLGMDALMLFDRVSVDFAKREVRVLTPGRSERRSDARFASRERPLSPS
jgi:predicted aspartyl protease